MPFVKIYTPSLYGGADNLSFPVGQVVLDILKCPKDALTVMTIHSTTRSGRIVVSIKMTARPKEIKLRLMQDVTRVINTIHALSVVDVIVENHVQLYDWMHDGKTWEEIVNGTTT